MLARRQALGARLGAQARALGVLALGRWAGRWGAGLGAGLGVQGARGRRACVGRAGVALGGMGAGALGGTGAGERGAGARGARAVGRGSRRGRARSVRGRAGWAAGARPGRLGWPWAVHSVHSAHFRSVLTRFFPESPNEHRSL